MSCSSRRSNNAVGLAVVGLIVVVGILGVVALRWYSGRTPDRSIGSAASGPPVLLQSQARTPTPAVAAGTLSPPQAGGASPFQLPPAVVGRFGTVLVREHFESPSSDLFAALAPGQPGRLVQEQGRLVIEQVSGSSSEPAIVTALAGRPPTFADGIVGIDALLAAGDDQAGYALYVRRASDNRSGYALWIRPRARSLQLWREVRSARNELAQVQTEALLPDRANQVALIVEGDHFEAFVNGESVLTASDATFASGRLGLAVGRISGGTPGQVRVAIEEFELRGLP